MIIILSAFSVVACDKSDNAPYNPYEQDNNFEVTVTDCEDALEFAPDGFSPKFGLIFYPGTLVNPEYYSYLGSALAKQGYLVVIPKVRNTLDYNDYNPNIATLTKYPEVKFFIGGHDAGGGLAVRHAMDYALYDYNMAGIILYAPIGFSMPKTEPDNDDNDIVWEHFSTENFSMYTLILEVDDELRTDALKLTAQEHTNNSMTTLYTLTDSKSAYFSTATSASETDSLAIIQRDNTVIYTLLFMKNNVKTLF